MASVLKEICREGESALLRLIADRTVETVVLDFKCKEDPSNGRFSKKDRQTLGQLLSGFANSSGGLVIWGIYAQKNEDGLDCAKALCPIQNIELFHSEAQTLCGQLLMPRYDGVQLNVIPAGNDPGRGYLIINVERSERRPHRCEAAGEKQYFKRAGDSFFAMEHYDIEDAFKRTTTPEITFTLVPITVDSSKQGDKMVRRITFSAKLTNVGDVVCRFPYLEILDQKNMHLSEPFGLPRKPMQDGWRCFYGGSDDIIHSDQSLTVAHVLIDHSASFFDSEDFSIRFTCRFGGGGMRRKETVIHFEQPHIADYFRSQCLRFS